MYQNLQGLPHGDLDLSGGIPIFELLGRGWRVFFSTGDIFLAFLLTGVIIMGSGFTLFSGSMLVIGPMIAGLSYYLLKIVRRETVTVGRIFDGFNLFGPALAIFLINGLIILGGTLLCFVPAIIFSIWYSFIWYIIADGERDIWGVFTKSKELTAGYRWEIFLFMLVCGLFNFLGFLICGVGLLITAPITMIANVMLYDLLAAHKGFGVRNPNYGLPDWSAGSPLGSAVPPSAPEEPPSAEPIT